MSCFHKCDDCGCSENESFVGMYHINDDVETILVKANYSDVNSVSDLCVNCVRELAKNDEINCKLGIDNCDEIVTVEDNNDVIKLKDYNF